MANIKVKDSDKRQMTAFSIRKSTKEKFMRYCKQNNTSASRLIETWIDNFLDDQVYL